MQIGAKIPPFMLLDQQNKVINPQDYPNKSILIYFYPKDNTPGCTIESKDFANYYQDFLNNNCLIWGISADSVECHQKFATKYQFPFNILADTDRSVCQNFGVIAEKSMFGKKYLGIQRSTFLFNQDHQLIFKWPKVKILEHAKEVLSVLKKHYQSLGSPKILT